jgi:WD40 repeat protein
MPRPPPFHPPERRLPCHPPRPRQGRHLPRPHRLPPLQRLLGRHRPLVGHKSTTPTNRPHPPPPSQTLSCRHTFAGHVENVASVASDGDFVASASFDASIRVWRIAVTLRLQPILTPPPPQTSSCETILRGHDGAVTAVAMRGDAVFSGGDDSTIRFWSLSVLRFASLRLTSRRRADASSARAGTPAASTPSPSAARCSSAPPSTPPSECGTSLLLGPPPLDLTRRGWAVREGILRLRQRRGGVRGGRDVVRRGDEQSAATLELKSTNYFAIYPLPPPPL